MLNQSRSLLLIFTLLLFGCQKTAEPTATPTAAPAEISETALAAPTALAADPSGTPSSLYLPLTSSGQTSDTAAATTAPTDTPSFPIYQGTPISRSDFGIQVHLHQENIPRIFDHLQALGAGWVKAQVSWKLYQPYPDSYSEERFTELDNLVATAAARGISVLLSVSKAPEWSRPTTELDGPPIDYALYEGFMRYLAERYQGRVKAYELWNEPNLQREWNGTPLSGADFVTLMKLGAAGVRAGDAGAILISGAPATTGINDRIAAIDDRIYFREMINAGAADVVDAVGVHPYGWANPPDSSAAAPDAAAVSHNNHPSFFFKDTLLDYLSILKENGVEKPLWITEFGWGSFNRLEAAPPANAEFMSAVTEWQQAVYTLRAYQLAAEWDFVGPTILWNLNFGPLLGDAYSETGYSILRPDGSRRIVYLALEAMEKSADP